MCSLFDRQLITYCLFYFRYRYRQPFIRGSVEFPARSPDLTPMDFFFWGYLKDKVYAAKPETIEGLKEEIRIKCLAISNEVLRNVIESIVGRYQLCLENEGRQFEHLRV